MQPIIDHTPECANLSMGGQGGGGAIVQRGIRFLGNQRIGAVIFSIPDYRPILTVGTAAGSVHIARKG